MTELRSMNHKLVQGLLYVRHREQTVRDEDWQSMLDDIARSIERGGVLKILVKTENAGPNVVQRSKLYEVITSKNGSLQIAVLSSSMLVRGIITAFSWMKKVEIRSFGPRDYAAALAYLEVRASVDAAERAITEIERAVA